MLITAEMIPANTNRNRIPIKLDVVCPLISATGTISFSTDFWEGLTKYAPELPTIKERTIKRISPIHDKEFHGTIRSVIVISGRAILLPSAINKFHPDNG